MSTTDETKAQGDGAGEGPPPKRQPRWVKPAKRYGPIVVVLALVGAAVLVFGGGGDDGDDEAATDGATASEEELISSGPMTWQKAEQEGETANIDWGPNCDTDTGQIKLVSVYAPPCVEPFEGDNAGATSPGVTGDTIKIVHYISDPALDPLAAATVSGAGADVSPQTAIETSQGFADLYNKLFETYGRRVEVEHYIGTGAGDDLEAAKADAIAIAEMDPFMVIGGPATGASPAFATELGARGILCGSFCALAIPESIVEEYAPYLWQQAPIPNQAAALAAEMIGKLAGPGKAELAGDDATRAKDRVYGLLHYDTPDGDHQEVFEALRDQLADNGIELATDVEFTLDFARAQENARTNIARLKDAGVTTVIYYGDPFNPGPLTMEATAQDYHPEWIMGPTALMDTALFARLTDMDQWKNGFGIGLAGARGAQETNGAFRIWDWAYGGLPPNNTANVLEPRLRMAFTGIHLAGPELTPETFRDGLFRAPPAGGGPTEPQVSRGDHGVWPDTDWGGIDDAAIVWLDPTAEGEDEVGNDGVGLYRYANGGQRYSLGEFPDSFEEAGLFDNESSVTIYDQVPPEDDPPDYPRPQ
jgi:hypothetical protein